MIKPALSLSTHEQKALANSAKKPPKRRRAGISAEIEAYPGRVVTVDQAYDRIKKRRLSLHDACTIPIAKNRQRNKPSIDASNPELVADLKSSMSTFEVSRKWHVAWRTIRVLRDGLSNAIN